MGKVVSHSKAEQAFHPWWDDLEDYMVYGLIMVGVVLIPTAIVTGTPLNCNFCPNRNQTDNPDGWCLNEDDHVNPGFNAWWTKEYCTYSGAVDAFLLYFPYFILLIALTLFTLEKVFQRGFKSSEKINKLYQLVEKQMPADVIDARFQAIELSYSLSKSRSYFYSYLFRTLVEELVALTLLVYMVLRGLPILTNHHDINCVIHGFKYQCHGIPINFYLFALYLTVTLTSVYTLCNLYNLLWLLFPCFGGFSRLMNSYINIKAESDAGKGVEDIYNNNLDLRLLLDLLAHGSGVPTAISVLTLLDPEFAQDLEKWKIETAVRSKEKPSKAVIQFKDNDFGFPDSGVKGYHLMYLAEVCSETDTHARTAIEIIPEERQSASEIQNGQWLIEDLKDDEDYTVRVKTVLNGKTISMSCQTISQAEDGIVEKLLASAQIKASFVQPKSLNSDLGLEMTETV